MKKKIVTLVPLALLVVASLGSCRGNGEEPSKQTDGTTETSDKTDSGSSSTHIHTHDAEWSSDDTKHWHNATCGDVSRVDEADHEYGEWEVVEDATEDSHGLKKHTCIVCGHEETEEIEEVEHVHSMKYVKKVKATCESTGVKAHYECTTCGKLFKDEAGEEETTLKALTIKVSDHTYSTTWSYDGTNHWHDATCGHDAKGDLEEHDIVNGTCSVCGYVAATPGIQYAISNDGKSYIVTGVEPASTLSGKVIIGSTYNDLPVTAIADSAFNANMDITSLVIPGSIKNIGDYAFDSCKNLKEVVILDGVTSIGDYAFSHCENLETISLPNSVTIFGNYIFAYSEKLKYNEYDNAYYLGNSDNPYLFLVQGKSAQISTCIINDNCKAISNNAFKQSALTSITIPGSVKTIGDEAFNYCPDLKDVTISEGVLSIGDYAFVNCRGLQKVQIPNSIQSLGYQIFEYSGVSENYKTVCTQYDNCYYLGNSDNPYLVLVKASSDIESCTINKNCKLIMAEAFKSCNSLKNVTISDGVEFIGKYAFSYCAKLTSVVIPTSVTTIGDSIFKYSDNVSNVYYFGTVDDFKNVDNSSDFTNITINYYSATQPTDTTYKYWHYNQQGDIEVWHVHKIVEVSQKDATCEASGYKAHYKCEDCDKLFSDAQGKTETTLDALTIPAKGHTLVHHEAVAATSDKDGNIEYWSCSVCGKYFSDSKGTKEITDKSSVVVKNASEGLAFTDNGDGTLSVSLGSCTDTDIIIPATYDGKAVTSIAEGAFRMNSNITSVYIPKGITSIGYFAFGSCNNLKKVNLPEGLTTIEKEAFVNSAIESITIPSSLTTIGQRAFFNCGLKDIVIPETVTSMSDYVFAYCSGLDTVVINCKSINSSTFVYCGNIKNLIISKNVTNIGNYSFASNESVSVTNVYYKGNASDYASINFNTGNEQLKTTNVYYYSESKPEANISNYWHYDNSGEIEIWHDHNIQPVAKLDATCDTAGYEAHYKCEECGKLYSDLEGKNQTTLDALTIPAKGHTLVRHAAVDATSDKDGNIEYWECSVCGKYFSDSQGTTEITDKSSVVVKYGSVGLAFTKNTDGTYSVSKGTCTDKDIIIPSTYNGIAVTSIDEDAFNSVYTIESVYIPSSVTKIGEHAFMGCINLKKVIIPQSVTDWGSEVFYQCFNLTSVEINSKQIYSGLFQECGIIETLIISKNTTDISRGSFEETIVSNVYYMGSENEWTNVEKTSELNAKKVYYYSESKPASDASKYWHYVDGVPTVYTE